MNLYTNIMPFTRSFTNKGGELPVVPVGTTFAAMGCNNFGIILRLVEEIKSGENENMLEIIDPRVFDIAFREVDQLNQ